MLTQPASVSAPGHQWETVHLIPDKPSGSDYAYVVRDKAYACTRQGLLDSIATLGAQVTLVWTPNSNEPVRPEQIEFLVAEFQKRTQKQAKRAILLGSGLVAACIIVALALNQWKTGFRNLVFLFGAITLFEGLWEFYRTRSFTMLDAQADAGAERFAEWLKKKSVSGYTVAVVAAIIIVGFAQVLAGDKESIEAAGLVKSAVWQGQIWRLSTATLMHVNFMHFWMNFLGLLYLAKTIEQTIRRCFVPIVFFLSGICGSLLSLLLYPHTTSVGASGGILGLLGFLTIEVWLAHERYPINYLRRLLEGIVFTGVLGLIGFSFIDNGAHLGGLLGGVGLGWYFLRSRKNSQKGLRWLSLTTVVLLFFGVLIAASKMLKL
jgi:rhomboid protease GluP